MHVFPLFEYANFTEGFTALARDEIDLLAGAPYNLNNDVNETSTGRGFGFSPIYYYDQRYNKSSISAEQTHPPSQLLTLATREEDVRWSDFVRWIVYATIYAEEEGITADKASKMPILQLFGSAYKQAFRDVIVAVGNYGEMYERNLEDIMPRSGRNLLSNSSTSQLFPLSLTFYI